MRDFFIVDYLPFVKPGLRGYAPIGIMEWWNGGILG
jgi:hypothetical protein